MKKDSSRALLLYADSEHCADQLYLGGIFVPDPFLSIKLANRRIAVVSALEYTRVKAQSAFDEVLALESLKQRAKRRFRIEEPGMAEVVRLLAAEYAIEGWVISPTFPAGLALQLRRARVKLRVAEEGLFPERLYKSDEEAEAIRQGNAASAAGLRAASEVLACSTIENGNLHYGGEVLTSERLQQEIAIACLRSGAVANQTIAAGGDQACDPHCSGSGPLRPNELIIVDVFPRVSATGYHGDMTRTFLKGRASAEQRRLVDSVKEAHDLALGMVRARVSGARVHGKVESFFESRGYKTRKVGDVNEGFFHSTGHGLGLEVHEAPRIARQSPGLKAGMVVTIEPGLYYPGLGACRVEDVVRVCNGGCELLSHFPYDWEIE